MWRAEPKTGAVFVHGADPEVSRFLDSPSDTRCAPYNGPTGSYSVAAV
jgi:hypothetical protein